MMQVPYCRIKDALIARMVGRTRAEIIPILAELQETFNFHVEADPWEHKHAFHTYVNGVFSWIVSINTNWPKYGIMGV